MDFYSASIEEWASNAEGDGILLTSLAVSKTEQRQINELVEQENWEKERMERIRGMVGRHGLGPARTDNQGESEGAEAGPASTEMAEAGSLVDAEDDGGELRGWKRKGEDDEPNDTTMEDEAASEASTDKGVDRGSGNANEKAEPRRKRKKMKMTAEESGGNGAVGGKDGSARFRVTGDVNAWMHGGAAK